VKTTPSTNQCSSFSPPLNPNPYSYDLDIVSGGATSYLISASPFNPNLVVSNKPTSSIFVFLCFGLDQHLFHIVFVTITELGISFFDEFILDLLPRCCDLTSPVMIGGLVCYWFGSLKICRGVCGSLSPDLN